MTKSTKSTKRELEKRIEALEQVIIQLQSQLLAVSVRLPYLPAVPALPSPFPALPSPFPALPSPFPIQWPPFTPYIGDPPSTFPNTTTWGTTAALEGKNALDSTTR